MGAMKEMFADAEQELAENCAGSPDEGKTPTDEQIAKFAQQIILPRYLAAADARNDKTEKGALARTLSKQELLDAIAVAHGQKDLAEPLENKLSAYFMENGEMPYGVAKARTGDPTKWLMNKLTQIFGAS